MTYPRKVGLIYSETVNPTEERFYNGFVHAFDLSISHKEFDEAIRWCQDRFGPNDPEGDWMAETISWMVTTVWFRETAQALEFKLRWM
jgi:hypothetical protein